MSRPSFLPPEGEDAQPLSEEVERASTEDAPSESLPPEWQEARRRPLPKSGGGVTRRTGMILVAIAAVLVVCLVSVFVAGSQREAGGGSGSPTSFPERDINPGYNPAENPDKPFSRARETRPPVAHPTATPDQTWPTFPPPAQDITEWVEIDGDDGQSVKVPTSWDVEEGKTIAGYETMRDIVAMRLLARDRKEGCGERDFGRLGMLRRAEVSSVSLLQIAESDVTRWAEIRNTEREGDFYAIPDVDVEPFTFDNGNEGALATVSFVPMYESEEVCTRAMRFTVVAQESGGLVHRMLIHSYIGHEDSLPVEHERQILATFDVPS